jgi:hypothetical protein
MVEVTVMVTVMVATTTLTLVVTSMFVSAIVALVPSGSPNSPETPTACHHGQQSKNYPALHLTPIH